MKISIVGSRGIPAKYGGFETFAEKISTKLVERKHSVTVSCEYESKRMEEYRDVKLCYFPFPPPKSYFLRKFYEIFSDIYFIYKLSGVSNFIYVLGAGAGLFLFIPKIFGKKSKVMVNIDGVEWKRDKFTRLEKLMLKINVKFATLFADIIILDSNGMKKYVSESFWKKTVYIPYGVEEPKEIRWDKKKVNKLLEAIGTNSELIPNNYWLVVARLEPENNTHTILKGFLDSEIKKPLLVVGDFTSKKYRAKINEILKNDKEGKVMMTGGIYDRELLFMLRQNCFGYIHGHSVGGTNPSLLEAMVMKNLVIAHDNEFNREVGGDAILYFKDANELTKLIQTIENNPEKYIHLKKATYDRVKSNYSWDDVVEKYERVFEEIGGHE